MSRWNIASFPAWVHAKRCVVVSTPLTRPRGWGVDVDWRSVPSGRQDDGRLQRRIGRRRSHVDGIPARRREPDAVGPCLVRIGLEVRERMVRGGFVDADGYAPALARAQVHLFKANKPLRRL